MKRNDIQQNNKGFLNNIIETCLELWIKNKCTSISNIKVLINSKNKELLRGYINNVQIIAEHVNFKNLLLESVNINANNIKIKLDLASKSITIEDEVIVNITIKVSERSLEKTLLSKKWYWLGCLMSKELIGMESLKGVNIVNNELQLKCTNKLSKELDSKKVTLNILTKEGRILLINNENSRDLIIPMEESIYIKNALLNNNILTISGNAKVKE
tara:strand:+ start:16758 stop:17402 length:645 start_codon:yes stop_codon:yes gene_type:complete